jgi:hypothetical protein
MKPIFTPLFIFLYFLTSNISRIYGQDSTNLLKKLNKIEFEISGDGYYQNPTNTNILLPNSIKEIRKVDNNNFNQQWNKGTDNPLFHFAYYLSFNSKTKIHKNITLWASLITEHRGFSYGVNNVSSILLFPQVRFEYHKKIAFLNDSLKIFISEGNQLFNSLYEGLTINNLYQQGHDVNIGWRKFNLRYFQLADLRQGIGLNIDDSYDYIASLEGINFSKRNKLDIRLGYSFYPEFLSVKSINRNIYNVSFGLYNSKSFRFYAQTSLRPNDDSIFNNIEKLASLVGVKFKIIKKKIQVDAAIEGRFYGAGFNSNFKNTNVNYRKSTINNSVGEYFYPLLQLDRPFSQWAAYSEYQSTNTYQNIGSILCQINSFYTFNNNFTINANLDFNYMIPEKDDPFLYPFYNIGFGWKEDLNCILIGITNKGMNLDLHYPTYYLFSEPTFSITLKRTLPKSWNNL